FGNASCSQYHCTTAASSSAVGVSALYSSSTGDLRPHGFFVGWPQGAGAAGIQRRYAYCAAGGSSRAVVLAAGCISESRSVQLDSRAPDREMERAACISAVAAVLR